MGSRAIRQGSLEEAAACGRQAVPSLLGAGGGAAWGDGGGLSRPVWLASAPGILVSAASRDLLAQEPVPPGSGDGTLQVRLSGGREAWGWGWGAQAEGQSERYPHPWEDWEAGAESQPHPLQLRVTPDQDHLSLPIPAQSSLPMRIRPPLESPGCRWGSSLILPTLTQQLPVDSLP